MKTRAETSMILASCIALLAAACAEGSESPGRTAEKTEALVVPAGLDLEELPGPEDLPEPEMDLTDVIDRLHEGVDRGIADVRHQADVRGEAGIQMVATGVAGPIPSAWFQPAILVGEPGQSLTLALSNPDRLAHTFTVPKLAIDVDLPTNMDEPVAVQVRFPDGGEPILFSCTFNSDYGQVGALVASN